MFRLGSLFVGFFFFLFFGFLIWVHGGFFWLSDLDFWLLVVGGCFLNGWWGLVAGCVLVAVFSSQCKVLGGGGLCNYACFWWVLRTMKKNFVLQ